MGLFDKKYCDICGNKIGLLGNRKLEDGNLCKDCAAKLSPYFSERRSSTVDQIRRQLDYRAANEAALGAFKVTKTLNGNYKILVDEDAECFVIARSSSWRESNPDIIPFSEITGCSYEVKESKKKIDYDEDEQEQEAELTDEEKEELRQKELEEAREEARREGYREAMRDSRDRYDRYDRRGSSWDRYEDEQDRRERELRERERELDARERELRKEERPEYEYSYDFSLKIFVSNPYFDEITLKMNGSSIKDKESDAYRQVEQQCEDIKNALLAYRASVRGDEAVDLAAAAASIGAVSPSLKQCPWCGETVEPDANGNCPNCGAAF